MVSGWHPVAWGRGCLLIGNSDKPFPEGKRGVGKGNSLNHSRPKGLVGLYPPIPFLLQLPNMNTTLLSPLMLTGRSPDPLRALCFHTPAWSELVFSYVFLQSDPFPFFNSYVFFQSDRFPFFKSYVFCQLDRLPSFQKSASVAALV